MSTDHYHAFARVLSGNELFKNVLLLGSGPSAPQVARFLRDDTIVVALNNAHRALARVDFSVYSGDFPAELKHPASARIGRSTPQYFPAIQECGGMIYCGATIAFASAYWAIRNLPYSQVSLFACDMVYPAVNSHFYGQGRPDPLRKNISLQSLPAKSLRVFYFGLLHNVLFLNASEQAETRLRLPRVADGASLATTVCSHLYGEMQLLCARLQELARPALALEASDILDPLSADYLVYTNSPDAWEHARQVDAQWLTLEAEVTAFGHRVNQVLYELRP